MIKNQRQRICGRDLSMSESLPPIQVVPKSETTKERLRTILSNHFIFGDLEKELREEIIDAFQDVRVSPGTEVIKQGDVADYFYIIDVGEFEILVKKGNEPFLLLRTRGAGESFGDLAMMYDTTRNATVKATSHALLWTVNRITFKSILGRHLSESSNAQVLREAPALKKLSTKEIVMLGNNCSIMSYRRGDPILTAGSSLDRVYTSKKLKMIMMEKSIGGAEGGGETLTMLSRLEVLSEALLLNEESTIPYNYNAASDETTIITVNRELFTKDMLTAIRKGLQNQLITCALQHIHAFLELSPTQLSQLAETFSQTVYAKGKEITRIGDMNGSAARIFVVQRGTVSLYKLPSSDEKLDKSETSSSSAGNKHNSILKGSSGSSIITSGSEKGSGGGRQQSHLRSNKLGSGSSTQEDLKPTREVKSAVAAPASVPAPSAASTNIGPFTVTTYGVFGDECLLGTVKDENSHGTPCQATTVAESKAGVVVLSVSLAEVTLILGPIQELLSRVVNLKVLRKLVYLEYLTSPEISMLSHSMGVHRMKAGETIYKAGELTDRLYVVHRGTVIMTPHDKKADQIVLVKGSYFGEDALMSNEPCLSTMVAGQRGPLSLRAELYYLDREVLEANLGPLKELNEARRREDEKRGIVKNITFEELEEIGVLGAGLFGKVKLVYSHHTKEHYALKCVSKAKVVKMQEEEHLRNEKIHMSDLDHPFITKLIRTFKDARNVYLLVELTTGGELFLFMEKMGRLQEWEAAFYAGSVLLALEYMHSKGIVYRDLKPENTMISESGYPKLIDMGFAKRIHNRRTFSMCGTPDYMAPEIIKRQGHGKGVDYWALGCLIFEMITNTSPFNKGDDPPQVVFRTITQGNVRFPPYMSANAIDIVKQLLDPNPETRLGCRKSGTAEIKEHPFFNKVINFQLLIREKEEAPMVPPKVSDYRKLCVIVDSGDPHDIAANTAGNKTDWDDIF
ncbi:hypothetical protein CY35_07G016400 [Sphagnum magellanicum]|uniref:Uncharacterized protein n=1 Tax=Sphagnum magellanicum TaxID=128215 RepID=A0ACB8HJ53_9BRYO|nr:hypothetical protein CY35_07G016400 [Sphagnum magellanicum]